MKLKDDSQLESEERKKSKNGNLQKDLGVYGCIIVKIAKSPGYASRKGPQNQQFQTIWEPR